MKVLISKDPKKKRVYYVNPKEDFHCAEGLIKKSEFKKSEITTPQGNGFYCLNASSKDALRHIKRLAQIITLKDAAIMLAEAGVDKDSTIIEAGAGSGSLTCFLAQHVKKVYSYEMREDHANVVEKNLKTLNIKNVKLHIKDITKGIKEKKADAIFLDMPTPWEVYEHAANVLKSGQYLILYLPTTPQIGEAVERASPHFLHEKTIELIERKWKVEGKAIRPKSEGIGHTAFITVLRRL